MNLCVYYRLKLEEEHRQREQERERERERERREKSKKSPRGSPSHSQQETSGMLKIRVFSLLLCFLNKLS